jgi:hypothetical protein
VQQPPRSLPRAAAARRGRDAVSGAADQLGCPYFEPPPWALLAHRVVKLGADEFGGCLFQGVRVLRLEQGGGSGDHALVCWRPPFRVISSIGECVER